MCHMRNEEVLDVLHIFLRWFLVEKERIIIIKAYRETRDIGIAELLGDKVVVADISNFLNDING